MGTTGPDRAEASRTAECSTGEQATGPGSARVAPHTAALTASVPPEVNTTWRGRTAEQPRHLLAGLFQLARTIRPSVWTRPGSAVTPDASQAAMASRASGRTGEVEAWSR